MRRQQITSHGARTVKLSVTLPSPLVAALDERATAAKEIPGWRGPPTTRSGQMAHVLSRGLAAIAEAEGADR